MWVLFGIAILCTDIGCKIGPYPVIASFPSRQDCVEHGTRYFSAANRDFICVRWGRR
jgi:hypothetical protein